MGRRVWVDTVTLAEELGVRPKFIRDRLKDLVFKQGIHYRNINPTAWRPTYRWNLKRCLEKMDAVEIWGIEGAEGQVGDRVD